MTRHFVRDDDLTPAEQSGVLDLAQRLVSHPYSHRPLAGPQTVALLFDKPSTRTRVSFAVGVAELGGVPLVLDAATSQLGRGETVEDTARVLDRQVAAIVWRTFAQHRVEAMAATSAVPVVNALTDAFHPCQLLADLLTVRQRRGVLAGLRFTYVGDGGNNMAHSTLLAGATAGMHVCIGSPEQFAPNPDVLARAAAIAAGTGGSVRHTTDPADAFAGADVVSTDTWVSMGQEDEAEQREAPFLPFAVTPDAMAAASQAALVLHCLPAYRGKEIDATYLDDPASAVWDQAENRRHAQKALLAWLLDPRLVDEAPVDEALVDEVGP
jgi:ornithine carbamoyltransferase